MDPVLLAAILSFAVRFGIPAVLEFLRNLKGSSTTIEDAIAALEKAQAKSIEDYIAQDAAARSKPPTGLVTS